MRSEAVENYLKTIHNIRRETGRVTTSTLAERLEVAPPSVTGMLKKLGNLGLVTYEPYRSVELTDRGEEIALEVIRHHRLIELYLTTALGVPWDRVHDEAERWEHVISEDIEDRIDDWLGHPTSDPHGAPIPTRDGKLPAGIRMRLSDLEPGQGAVLAEVDDRDPSLLRHADSLGLRPGTALRVIAKAPFGGSISLIVGGVERVLGGGAAAEMLVSDVTGRPEEVA